MQVGMSKTRVCTISLRLQCILGHQPPGPYRNTIQYNTMRCFAGGCGGIYLDSRKGLVWGWGIPRRQIMVHNEEPFHLYQFSIYDIYKIKDN